MTVQSKNQQQVNLFQQIVYYESRDRWRMFAPYLSAVDFLISKMFKGFTRESILFCVQAKIKERNTEGKPET